MTGDVARIVVHDESTARLPLVTPAVPGAEAEEQATAHNRQVIEEADPEALLPGWRQVVADGEVGDRGQAAVAATTPTPPTRSPASALCRW